MWWQEKKSNCRPEGFAGLYRDWRLAKISWRFDNDVTLLPLLKWHEVWHSPVVRESLVSTKMMSCRIQLLHPPDERDVINPFGVTLLLLCDERLGLLRTVSHMKRLSKQSKRSNEKLSKLNFSGTILASESVDRCDTQEYRFPVADVVMWAAIVPIS